MLHHVVAMDGADREKLQQSLSALGLPIIGKNMRRFERYGIATVDISDTNVVGQIRKLPGVQSVSVDEEKQSLTGGR